MLRFRNLILGSAVFILSSFSVMAGTVNYNLSSPSGNLGTPGHVYGGTDGVNNYNLSIYGATTSVAPVLSGYSSTTQSWSSGTWAPTGLGATNLYGKTSGAGETGLGVVADPLGENEEFSNNGKYGFLVLDVTAFEKNPNLLYFQLQIGSAQSGELFTIWGTNSASCTTSAGCSSLGSATLLASGGQTGNTSINGPFDVNNWANYQYIIVGAEIAPGSGNTQANVLLNADIAFTDTPVPGTAPEPSTLALAGSSLFGAAFLMRRRLAKR